MDPAILEKFPDPRLLCGGFEVEYEKTRTLIDFPVDALLCSIDVLFPAANRLRLQGRSRSTMCRRHAGRKQGDADFHTAFVDIHDLLPPLKQSDRQMREQDENSETE